MENSSINGLIYQAVYIGIFILAVSITINLFSSINRYVDVATNSIYGDSISDAVTENESIFVNVDEQKPYVITGYEVYTLVNNYGMYINETNYQYGKKYNGELKSLKYRVKVYIKDGSGNYVIAPSVESINLLKSYRKIEENFSENYIEFREI